MLLRSDLQLIRRDRGIPGLATLLDPEAFLAALRPQVPEVRLDKAVAHYVRYKPGRRCLVAYRLQLEHGEAAVYASAHGADALMKLQKVRERPGMRGTLGPGRIILPDHDVTVSVFPNDRMLKTLAQLDGGDAQTRLVRRVLADRSDLWDADFRCLAYKPERRYVAVLHGSQGARAVFKFYDAEGFPAARGAARSFQSRSPLRIARLLGRSKRKRVLALEWLPGRPLGEVLSDPKRRREAAETTGTALAALHTQTPGGLSVLTRGAEAGALLAVAAEIGFLLPSIADRARDLAQRVAERLPPEPARGWPIHGDFYARQVLLTDGAVALLDLDEARYGDPAADLGNFGAHLEWADLADAREELTEALLRGYRCAASPPPRAAIDLYTAAGLLRLAPHFFRSRQGDWAERTEAAVERAEALFSRLCRPPRNPRPAVRPRNEVGAPSIPVESTADLANDERLSFLQQALDPLEVQRQFDLQLSEALGRLLVRKTQVVRYKPGRRCLIEYEVEVERDGSAADVFTLIGKARAGGLDSRAYRSLEALWRAGFAADSEDLVSVPEPLGTIPDFHMWLQRKVPGVSATSLMAGPEGIALAVRIAEAAHKLHRTAVPTFRRHTLEDELRILHERLAIVAEANPVWVDRLDRILSACERLGAAVPKARPIGIHRDFYADQVVVDGSRLHLVDFDQFCEGDPALDIGNFIGHLTEQSLRELGNPTALADRERALEERFLTLAGEERRSAVGSYTTLTLVRHISISTQFPERRRITETLLDLCEERLGVAPRSSRRLPRSAPARGPQAPGSRP